MPPMLPEDPGLEGGLLQKDVDQREHSGSQEYKFTNVVRSSDGASSWSHADVRAAAHPLSV